MIEPLESFESVRTRFVTTNWSIVVRAGDGASQEDHTRQQALSELYGAYWPPIYAFVRKQGHGRAEAQDLTQDFFVYLMEQAAYAKADAFKGRFRSFLLGWLKKFLLASHAREIRLKRGGDKTFVFLDAEVIALENLKVKELVLDPPPDEERLFEWHWAVLLIDRAMKTLEVEYAGESKARLFKELKPYLQGGADLPSQAEVAKSLGMPAETLRSHLARLRAHYRRLLLQEVARTVADSCDVEEELGFLYRVLTAASFRPPVDS